MRLEKRWIYGIVVSSCVIRYVGIRMMESNIVITSGRGMYVQFSAICTYTYSQDNRIVTSTSGPNLEGES